MINPRRLSIVPTPVLRSVVLAAGIVGLLAISGPEANQTTGAASREDVSASASAINEGLDGTLQAISLQSGSASADDSGQSHPDHRQLDQTKLATAEPSFAGALPAPSIVTSDVKIPEPDVDAASANASQAPLAEKAPPAEKAPVAEQAQPVEHAQPTEDVPPKESAPAQVASVNPQDVEPGSDFGLDLGSILSKADKATKSFDLPNPNPLADTDVDQYLWALYQRTPKEDTLKTIEWRDVTVERKVKIKGKGKGKEKTKTVTVTVSKPFTKLVDQDFTWKDPKAAERAGMPMMDYVIGGMDRGFRLKLFQMLRAADAAGLSPGITSGFRDDYRQSIASGLKAASNRSYHGGSLRGGYGHGLAADVVSVDGATRNERFASSTRLWKWVDAHGKEFGIARPYLGRDPPHVAPTDGAEYAKHSRGTKLAASDKKKADVKKTGTKQAASNAKEVKKPNLVIMRDSSRLAKRVDARDDQRLSKRATVRNSARPAKRPRTTTASR